MPHRSQDAKSPTREGEALPLTNAKNFGCLSHHFNPHRPRGALDALDRRLNRGRVQVRHLLRGDLAHLLLRHLADLFLVRRA